MIKAKKRLNNENGQSMVEFALVFPIFIMIIFLIIDFAWISYQRIAFRSACTHADWTTADRFEDNRSYVGASIRDYIIGNIRDHSALKMDTENMTVSDENVTLFIQDTDITIPGSQSGEVSKSIVKTRKVKVQAKIAYVVRPLVGFSIFIGTGSTAVEKIDTTRVVKSTRTDDVRN